MYVTCERKKEHQVLDWDCKSSSLAGAKFALPPVVSGLLPGPVVNFAI